MKRQGAKKKVFIGVAPKENSYFPLGQAGGFRKTVYIGLSGGVDSSVSAALLKKQGYDVTGVFIKVWQPNWITCTWKEDRLDAMRVCAKLEIPFLTLDLEKEYKRDVVDYMIREYKAGRTPNPDVMCNKYIKFGAFYNWARKRGADYVATGHYARIEKVTIRELSSINDQLSIENSLKIAVDTTKDQTYFLYGLTSEQLAHILFPVGHLKKPEVRKIAKEFGLSTADKKDSQGLCFVGKVDMTEFLSHFIQKKNGNILDERGQKIGHHEGALFFTIGERHGFTVTKKSTHDRPLYVVSKDLKKNTITVSPRNREQNTNFDKNLVLLKNITWNGEEPSKDKVYYARIRYRQTLEPCLVRKKGTGRVLLEFKSSQRAVTPGQFAVIYDEDVCLGGGEIVM